MVRTLLRITHIAHRKSYLVIICPNSHEKLTKSVIRSLLFSPIWLYQRLPFLSIFTYIYLNLAVFRLNCPYLGIFALNCADFTICAIFTPYMYSSIETAPLCNKILEILHIGQLFMEILHFKDLGDTSVISECSSLGDNLVIDNFFYVASGTSPLFKI